MKLINIFQDTGYSVWDERRHIANEAIRAYNSYMLGEICVDRFYIEFGKAYIELDSNGEDEYAEQFNLMKKELENAGKDVSFYEW